MKCKRCGNEVNSDFCPNCGFKIKKISIMMIVLTILLILSILIVAIPSLIILIYASTDSANDAVGWLLFFLWMLGIPLIFYHLILFGIGLLCEKIKNKTAIIIKNILLSLASIIPLILFIILMIVSSIK